MNINEADKEGNIPLHLACNNGSIEIIEILLENGTQTNYFNNRGKSPLNVAEAQGNYAVIRMLEKWPIQVEQAKNKTQKISRLALLVYERINFKLDRVAFVEAIVKNVAIKPKTTDPLPKKAPTEEKAPINKDCNIL